MFTITSDNLTGKITIEDIYDTNIPTFNYIDEEYTLSFINLKNVKYFKNFKYEISGNSEFRYLKTSYRVSKDNKSWTNWQDLDTTIKNFPPFDPKYDMFIDIKWVRKGNSDTGIISLLNYNLSGSLDREINDGLATVKLDSINSELIIKPPYIYKVFKIEDIEILSSGDINNTDIYYRFSQDYGRTVNNWILFTKENIRSERINPIRFFQIEYYVKYNGTTKVSIFDINILGDFQNVSLDSLKTNLYGLREDCNCLMLNIVGDTNTVLNSSSGGNTSMLLANNKADLYKLTAEDIGNLYKPYQQDVALALFNKLSNDSTAVLGFSVVYVYTDPDKNGIDYTLHEYQLQNYVCHEMIKISVENNNFPDNQVVTSQYDLMMLESFQITITKDIFKKAFGLEKRPGADDFLWFCDVNRIYTVSHAQPVRNFNNNAIYYKVMLKKFNNKANIIGVDKDMEDFVGDLVKNTTIGELFGLENEQDKKSVNNEQLRPNSMDILRVEILANINKENIENASMLVSRSNYDLSSTGAGSKAIKYRNFKNVFQKSDNIGFMSWFNINNITINDNYNLFSYIEDNKGFEFYIIGNSLYVKINNITHNLEFSTLPYNMLEENIWYSIIINVDQRSQNLNAFIYKRNTEYEEDAAKIGSSKLKLLYKMSKSITPQYIEVETESASILGSDMKCTNIRLFVDVIPEKEHNKILNDEIIGVDNKYIIFADNANKKLTLPFYTDSKVDYSKIRRGTNLDEK